MLSNFILLQAGASGSDGGWLAGGGNILMIVALIAIFYFMMIRPQQKRQKEIKKFREGVSVGDRVVTAGGIHGKVRSIKDTVFVIEIAPNTNISVDKGSVYPGGADVAAEAASNENLKK